MAGTTVVHVSAALGGTVSDPAGKTTLTIPPGALEADTDITLSVEAASAGAATDVSSFGPDGLRFVKPVTLSIKGDASLAPPEKSLAIATLEGGAFRAVEGSTYADGAASAPIMHFSKYSMIVVDGRVVSAPPASCAATEAAFAPCGGDPTGTWTFAEFCLAPGGAGKVNDCPELTASADYEFKRDVVIDASTITITPGSYKATITINYPLVCFTRMADGGTSDAGTIACSTVQDELYTKKGRAATCVDSAGGSACSCTTVEEMPVPDAETSGYTISGSTMTTTDKDGKVSTSQFCVDGDTITSKEPDVNGVKGQLFVLKRKK